jgi:hypothetical protein
MLTDGGKVVYAPAALYSTETLYFRFWYSFLLGAKQTPGPSAVGCIRRMMMMMIIIITIIIR